MLRIHKQRTRAYLVHALENAPGVADIPDEWEDMIYVRLVSGALIVIYLWDRAGDVLDVQQVFEANTRRGLHTLVILSAAMLLPEHKALYQPEDWMLGLAEIYGGKIYNYRVMRLNVDICPMHFAAVDQRYRATFGDAIEIERLQARRVMTPAGDILLADFGGERVAFAASSPPPQEATAAPKGQAEPATAGPDFSATEPHRVLGVAHDADRATVKARFRDLARRYHPDADPRPGAKARMQALNAAYRALIHHNE